MILIAFVPPHTCRYEKPIRGGILYITVCLGVYIDYGIMKELMIIIQGK